MKIIQIFSLYILTILFFLQGWLLAAFVFMSWFSFRYNAIVFMPTAVLLDGYFGHFYSVPILSLLSVIWFVAVEYLKPKMATAKDI